MGEQKTNMQNGKDAYSVKEGHRRSKKLEKKRGRNSRSDGSSSIRARPEGGERKSVEIREQMNNLRKGEAVLP